MPNTNIAENYSIHMLTQDSVSIQVVKVINIENAEYTLSSSRKVYVNSNYGRQLLQNEVPGTWASAVFEIWGNEPTVEDLPTEETQMQEEVEQEEIPAEEAQDTKVESQDTTEK